MKLGVAVVVAGIGVILMRLPAFAADSCVGYINSHPAVSDVMTNPGLIYDQHYLNQHPNFRKFLNKHPGVCDNFASMGGRNWQQRYRGRGYETGQPYNKEQRVEREQRMHQHGTGAAVATPATVAPLETRHRRTSEGVGTLGAAASPTAPRQHRLQRGGDSTGSTPGTSAQDRGNR